MAFENSEKEMRQFIITLVTFPVTYRVLVELFLFQICCLAFFNFLNTGGIRGMKSTREKSVSQKSLYTTKGDGWPL